MQSAALIVPDPIAMLEAAQQTLLLHADDGIATAIAAIFDPETLEIEIASAGHPGPTIRRAAGAIEDVNVPGIMLGLGDGDSELQRVKLAAGDAIVFYTDGLVEATRDLSEGVAHLHAALESADACNAEHPARALMDRILPNRDAIDDTAILYASVR